ncbi:MAG: hypothetical protein M1404_07345 [Acidobacteria bacterium]|nr:hypothetical protein [Acidobacteriota bacterium]
MTYLRSAILVLVLIVVSAPVVSAAPPLSKDDITLLLIGGASEQKMVALVEQRGVDFQLTPELIDKFHKLGATSALIDAIVKSNRQQAAQSSSPSSQSPSPPSGVPSQMGPQLPGLGSGPQVTSLPSTPVANSPATTSGSGSGPQNSTPIIGSPAAKAAKPVSTLELSNPSPERIQQIIQAFAAKEAQFKAARDNYTYHQLNKVETINTDGQIDGVWEQDWDILFNDQGKRIERVTYAPVPTLKRIMVTEQDLNALRSIQPFVLTTPELPEYDIQYLGHVRVDYITAYVFSVRPKEIKKGHQYFKGVVWVDDRDLQIVKAQGRNVPELKTKHGENLFPEFTTWRQQIDGKYWFPTFTKADDTLYFSSGPVHIREIIRYTDYKQFRSTSRILSVAPDSTQPQSNKPAPKK